MPPQIIDLECHQAFITELYHNGLNQHKIAETLNHECQISVSYRTVQRRFTAWGLSKRIKIEENPAIDMCIAALFFHSCLGDDDILKVMTQEGFILSHWGLVRKRKKLGLLRKIAAKDMKEADEDLLKVVRKAFDDETIQKYGRGLLWTHFRSHGNLVSRYVIICCTYKIKSD